MKLDQDAIRAFAKRVQPMYAVSGWTWGRSVQPPTEAEIVDRLNKLAAEVTGDVTSVGTGGLRVYCEVDDDGVTTRWAEFSVKAEMEELP